MRFGKVLNLFFGIKREDVEGRLEESGKAREETREDLDETKRRERGKRLRGARLVVGADVRDMTEEEFMQMFEGGGSGD